MTSQPPVPRVLQKAGGSDRPDWPAIESAIRQLAVNYALGTDAIGRCEAETGRALYRQTFTGGTFKEVASTEPHIVRRWDNETTSMWLERLLFAEDL